MRFSFLILALCGLIASAESNDRIEVIKTVVPSHIDVAAKLSELKTVSWKKKARQDLALALVAVGFSRSGRELLRELTPLLENGEVQLVPIERSGGTAGFYDNGMIYLDCDVPLIALVTTLFHEATHAVDWNATQEGRKRWVLYRNAKSRDQSDPFLLASEFKAYATQNRFLEELSKEDEKIAQALEYATTFCYLPPFPFRTDAFRAFMTAPEARGGYGVAEKTVDAFLKERDLAPSAILIPPTQAP